MAKILIAENELALREFIARGLTQRGYDVAMAADVEAAMSSSPADVVRRFCDAWAQFDIEEIMAFFTDDSVYHNIPIDPVVGKDGIRATVAMFTTGADKIEFRVRHLVADGLDVGDTSVGQRLHGATEEVTVVGRHALVAAEDRRQDIGDILRLEGGRVHHFEPCRGVAQEPMRPRHVARGQHEVVRAVGQGVHELANDVAKPRKALKSPEFERFIEQEGARLAAGSASRVEERQQLVECFTRAGGHRVGTVPAEWRARCDSCEKSFRRGRATLHVDVLGCAASDAVPQSQEQGRSTGSASAQDNWNP